MGLFSKKKKVGLQPKNGKRKTNGFKASIDETIFGGESYETTLKEVVDPVTYTPYNEFNKDLKAYATFFCIPHFIHDKIRENPNRLYPIDMSNPLEKGKKAKPISYSLDLIELFKRKEHTPERGKLYFGRVPSWENKEKPGEYMYNDIGLSKLINQYIMDFGAKFKDIDPTIVDEESSLDFPDPKGQIDLKTGKIISRGTSDVSKKQFTIYGFDNYIGIADGRLIKDFSGEERNQSSRNKAMVLDVNFRPIDLSPIETPEGKKSPIGVIARPHYPQRALPFESAFAGFGYKIYNNPCALVKEGRNLMMLVTPRPLIIPESSLTTPEQIELYGLKEHFKFSDAR